MQAIWPEYLNVADGQIDGQTDGRTENLPGNTALCVASRGEIVK